MHSVNTRGFYQGQDAYHHQPPKLKRYYTFLCPATLAAISFILVVLAIVAGQPRGFAHADDYSIIYVCALTHLPFYALLFLATVDTNVPTLSSTPRPWARAS